MSDRRTTAAPRLSDEDYYVENGCYVFTAEFLARRGWCCGNGCRHCPYEGESKRERPSTGKGE